MTHTTNEEEELSRFANWNIESMQRYEIFKKLLSIEQRLKQIERWLSLHQDD